LSFKLSPQAVQNIAYGVFVTAIFALVAVIWLSP
jgi:hypothetical protein